MKMCYKYSIAIIYGVALFLDRLDLTIVNITLASLSKIFHVSITSTDAISISFLLALAISMPVAGWLGERFGFKRIFVLSLLLFGLGSALCAIAPNLKVLIILRFIHGLGGGLLIPIGMTIIYRLFDKSEYASITSYTFIPSLIAPAIAPFLGGLLLDYFGWQVVFLFSGPIAIVLAIIVSYVMVENKHRVKIPLDWVGFIVFSAILIDIFYTLSLVGRNISIETMVINIFILFALIYSFIRVEQKPHPLINLNFFKVKLFRQSNYIQLCFQICHFGAIFLIGLYLQLGVGLSASIAGLMMGMQAVGAIVTSRLSVRLFNKSPRLPMIIGFLGIAVLSPCILTIHSAQNILFGMLLFFLRGIFSGLCGTPIQTLSVISFCKQELSTVNTLVNVCRQVSISLGVAISSLLISVGMHFSSYRDAASIANGEGLTVFGFGFVAITLVALTGVFILSQLRLAQINTH